MIYKILHRKLRIKHYEPHKKPGVASLVNHKYRKLEITTRGSEETNVLSCLEDWG